MNEPSNAHDSIDRLPIRGPRRGLFAERDLRVRETDERLLGEMGKLESVVAEPKKASVHRVAGMDGSAIAGVHPKKTALLPNIRIASPIKSRRVRTVERVSKIRFHNELLLESPNDVDDELLRRLRFAHALASGITWP